jgi:predicted outer membrane repeat protein
MEVDGKIKGLVGIMIMLMCVSAQADLVALWRFDANYNPQPDATVNSNDAVLAGNVTWLFDPDRSAMGFDGDNDYLEVLDSESLSIVGDMTIAAWIKVTDFNGYRGIVGKTNGNLPAPYDYYLYNGDGRPRFVRGDGIVNQSVTATNPPALGIWQHVAVTMSGTTVTHYLNGQVNGTGTLNTTIADAGGTLRIGSRADLETDMLGSMEDIFIYDHALTQQQIMAIINSTPGIQSEMALDFLDTDDRVIVSNYSAMPTTAITAEFWIKTSDTTRDAGLISYAVGGAALANEFLIFDSDDLQILVKGETTGPTGLSVADGFWHHVAVTWDSLSGQTVLYIDGITNNLGVLAQGQIITGSGTLVFGDEQDSLGGGFVASEALIGQLDDIRIWNTVRSQVDIDADLCQPLNGTESNLVSYWTCDSLDDLGVNGDGADDIADMAGSNPGDTENGLSLINNDSDGDGIANGCDTQRVHNLTQGTDFYGLQNAIDLAAHGDVIEADPGVYLEAINFIGKLITLRSVSGDPNDTIIDGTGYYHVVICRNGENNSTILQGFTITGGNANGLFSQDDTGGGMYLYDSSPTISNCIFSGNSANSVGGAVYDDSSNTKINDCIFIDNVASSGGGIFSSYSGARINNCSFIANEAFIGSGGGVNILDGIAIVSNCIFIGNTAASSGGGMRNLSFEGSNINVTNCIFRENIAIEHGGGMINKGGIIVTDCNFIDNIASGNGGGMYNDDIIATITGCIFNNNSANLGGGMNNSGNSTITVGNCTFGDNEASAGWGGGIYNLSTLMLSNSTFSMNSAQRGGGMYNSGGGNSSAVGCVFSENNTTDSGGGIYMNGGSLDLTNSTLNGNSTTDSGGGMYISNGSPIVTNCTFSGNIASTNGGGIYNTSSLMLAHCTFSGNQSPNGGAILTYNNPTIINTIIMDNVPNGLVPSGGSVPTVTYSNIQGGYIGDGNIDADPLFVNSEGIDDILGTEDDDLRLQAGSPCIDAGDSVATVTAGIATDQDDNPRGVDDSATPNTGVSVPASNAYPIVVDMGAYEFQVDCSLVGDINCDGIVDLLDLTLLAANWLATI